MVRSTGRRRAWRPGIAVRRRTKTTAALTRVNETARVEPWAAPCTVPPASATHASLANGRGKQRALFDLDLLRHQQCSGLVVVADLVELDLVGHRRGKPSAADDADLPTVEGQLGYVLGQTDEIIDKRPTHGSSVISRTATAQLGMNEPVAL